jgi:hypothetical protein
VVALVPLAVHQAGTGHTNWIVHYRLSKRLVLTAREFLGGPHMFAAAIGLYALVLLAGLVLLARTRSEQQRRGALRALGLGVVALALPLLAALFVRDAVDPRNLLVAWVPLAVGPAAGFAAIEWPRLGPALGVAACVIGLGMVLGVDASARLQRSDWRGAASALGSAQVPRIVVAPALGAPSMELYRPGLRAWGPATPAVRAAEIDLLDWAPPRRSALAPPPGFARIAVVHVGTVWISRYAAAAPRLISRASLAPSLPCPSCGDGKPRAVLVQGRVG